MNLNLIFGGQFRPASGGQFQPALGGQFKSARGGQFHRFLHLKSKYSGSLLDNYDYYLFSIKMNKLNCYSFVESEQNLELTVNQLLAEICN